MSTIANAQKHRSFRTLLLAVAIEPEEIGRRIRAARERRGWTQPVFAREANISLSTVQRWERGDLPPVRELIRIAGVLGIETDALVELEPTGEVRLAQLERQVEEQSAKLDRVLALLESPVPPVKAARRRSG